MKFVSNNLSVAVGVLLMSLPLSSLDAADYPSEGQQMLLTDFTANSSDLSWIVVNDNVMGGRSEGNFQQESGELSFTGRTNTNGGGFSSIRTKPLQLDLSDYSGIKLLVKADGRRYTWRLTTTAHWNGSPVSYWADFEAPEGQWSSIEIPFTSFIPRFRGSRLDGPALNPELITGMGLMIYDKSDGPFEIQLSDVSAYSVRPRFTLKQYQWENRVLVVSAPTEDDGRLVDQLNQLALTQNEFSSRDMTLVTLLDTEGSMAGSRNLTNEEAAQTRAALGIRPNSFALRLIGKDGTVKLSDEEPVSINDVFALIDTMPMRQREMSGDQ